MAIAQRDDGRNTSHRLASGCVEQRLARQGGLWARPRRPAMILSGLPGATKVATKARRSARKYSYLSKVSATVLGPPPSAPDPGAARRSVDAGFASRPGAWFRRRCERGGDARAVARRIVRRRPRGASVRFRAGQRARVDPMAQRRLGPSGLRRRRAQLRLSGERALGMAKRRASNADRQSSRARANRRAISLSSPEGSSPDRFWSATVCRRRRSSSTDSCRPWASWPLCCS